MSALADDFRKRSKEQAESSVVLFDADDFATSPKKQALAIIGQVNSTLYSALAETVDYLRFSVGPDSLNDRRAALLKRNDAIRLAAAKATMSGDWNEFDRLANGGDTAGQQPVASQN